MSKPELGERRRKNQFMKTKVEKLDEVLKRFELRCYQSGASGNKLTFVGIEGKGLDFNLSLTWHNEIIITDFKGTIKISDYCKLLSELENEITKLEL
jgi:hypothetical protein